MHLTNGSSGAKAQGPTRVKSCLSSKIHPIHAIHMMTHAHSSCCVLSYSRPTSSTFCSLSTFSSSTSSVTPCLNSNCAKIHRQEDYGRIAPYAHPTAFVCQAPISQLRLLRNLDRTKHDDHVADMGYASEFQCDMVHLHFFVRP